MAKLKNEVTFEGRNPKRGPYKVRLSGGPMNGTQMEVRRLESTIEVPVGGEVHVYAKKGSIIESSLTTYVWKKKKR